MRLEQTFKNIKRLQQIATVMARYGFAGVVEEIGLSRVLKAKTSRAAASRQSTPVRLRKAFEELGTTFVKLGQMLAIRPDLVPPDFVREFSKLQDRVKPVDAALIREQIHAEFGQDVSEIFAEFDDEAIGAASIAQVHRARFADGQEVVVKVRRPEIRDLIETDLSILFILADLLDRYIEAVRVINPLAIVDEFSRTIHEEMNFLHEARNIRRFKRNFADDPNVVIPDVVEEYSGHRVLTMDYLDGIPLRQAERLRAEGRDLKKLANVGIETFFKMVFIHGFFHGDIHGGNILAMENDRVGLIDFGVAGRFDDRLKQEVAGVFISLVTRDFRALARAYLRAALDGHEGVSPDAFARDLQRVLEPLLGLELKNIDSAEVMLEMASIAQRHRIQIPQELILLFRAIVALDGIGRELDPDFDVIEAASHFATDVVVERYKPERLMVDLVTGLRDLADMGRDMPAQVQTILRSAEEGKLGIDLRLRETSTLKMLRGETWKLSYAVIAAGGAITFALSTGLGLAALLGLSMVGVGATGLVLGFLKGSKRI